MRENWTTVQNSKIQPDTTYNFKMSTQLSIRNERYIMKEYFCGGTHITSDLWAWLAQVLKSTFTQKQTHKASN